MQSNVYTRTIPNSQPSQVNISSSEIKILKGLVRCTLIHKTLASFIHRCVQILEREVLSQYKGKI